MLITLWNMKIYIVTIRDFCIVHLHNVGTLLPQIVKAFSHISREIYPFLLNLGKGCNLRTMACISVKYDLLLLILVSELNASVLRPGCKKQHLVHLRFRHCIWDT